MGIQIQFESGRVQLTDERFVEQLCQTFQRGKSWKVVQMPESYDQYYNVPTDMFRGIDYGFNMRYGYTTYQRKTPRCTSCGEEHSSKLDHHGFCEKKATRFWGKVRKLYWNRYLKDREKVT